MRTKQETFNIVSNHLLTQRKRSESIMGCLYRGPHNLKCAAGVLIPDEKYVPEMDSRSHGKAILANDGIVGKVLMEEGHDPYFVLALQRIHDNENVWEWWNHLKVLADRHGLMFTADNPESTLS